MLLRCLSMFGAAVRLWSSRGFVRFRWLLVVAACVSTAQAQYRFDSWTTDDGLPQNSVYSILQTRDGYLWFTTFDGLVRFDGVKFTVFNKSNLQNLPTTRFIQLFAEDDGTLWVVTENHGLIRFRNQEIKTFTVADGLPSRYVQDVQKDVDGSLLIVTHSGLVRFKEGRFTVERQFQDFRDYRIYVAPSGARWEMDASGLRKSKDGQIAHYDLPFDADHINADRPFSCFAYVPMLEDREGALWFAAAGNLYKLQDGAVGTFTATDGVPPSHVRSIAQDREGSIWLGTRRDGACRVQANRFNCYKTGDGLSSNHIADIFSDREGTLWLVINAIKTVVRGEEFISPALTSYLFNRSRRAATLDRHKPTLKDLTEAERRVLKLIGQYKTSAEIADELFISKRTVDRHRENIAEKLGLKGSHSILKFALDHKDDLF